MAANEKRTLSITAKLVDQVSRGLGGITNAIRRFASGAASAFGGLLRRVNPVALGLTGLATAWASFKGGQTVVELLDGVDALDKLGDTVGTTVDRMAVLKGAFQLSGVDANTFQSTIKSLSKAISGVIDKDSKKLIDGLQRIGISVSEVRKLDALDLFDQMAKGLEAFGTAQERTGALARIFPREFQPLFAALANGQEQFRGLVAIAKLFIGTVSEDGAKAADRFTDSIDLLNLAMQSIGRDAFIEFARQFAEPIEKLATFLASNRDTIAQGLAALVAGVAKAFGLIAVLVVKLVAFIVDEFEELLNWLASLPVIGALLAKVFDAKPLSDAAIKIRKQMRGVADEIVETQSRISQIRMLPEEMDPTGERMKAFESKLKELRQTMASLGNDLDVEIPGSNFGDQAIQGASLRQLGDLLNQLANFQNLPGLPSDMSAAMRALFGKGGPEEAQANITEFFDGFSVQLDEVVKEWSDFGKAGRQAATTLVDGGLDGLVDTFAAITTGTKSAKEAFREYAQQLLSDLAKIIARLLIMNAVSSLFGPTVSVTPAVGAAKGGVIEGDMGRPVRKFARGGIAKGPTLAMFGEGRGAEAFVPLPDNRSIPVTINGGAGAAAAPIVVNITAMDSRDVKRLFMEQGNTLGAIIRDQMATHVGMRHAVQQAGR